MSPKWIDIPARKEIDLVIYFFWSDVFHVTFWSQYSVKMFLVMKNILPEKCINCFPQTSGVDKLDRWYIRNCTCTPVVVPLTVVDQLAGMFATPAPCEDAPALVINIVLEPDTKVPKTEISW